MYGHTKPFANNNRCTIDNEDITFFIANELELPKPLRSRVDEIKITEVR